MLHNFATLFGLSLQGLISFFVFLSSFNTRPNDYKRCCQFAGDGVYPGEGKGGNLDSETAERYTDVLSR